MLSRRSILWFIAYLFLPSLTLGQSGVAPIPYVPGMQMWLRANQVGPLTLSNLVTAWPDQTAFALDVSQADKERLPHLLPFALNGFEGLHFDGNDQLSRGDGMPLGSYTKIILFEYESIPMVGSHLLSSVGGGHGLSLDVNAHLQVTQLGQVVAQSSTALAPLVPYIAVVTYESSTQLASLYVNGQLESFGPAPGDNPDTQLCVGGIGNLEHFLGTIAEVVVFDHALSNADRTLMESYFTGYYQLAQSFPGIEFSEAPRDAQVYPRMPNGFGIAKIAGQVTSSGFQTIELKTYRNGVLYSTRSQSLSYAGGAASFVLSTGIFAECEVYHCDVTLTNSTASTTVERFENLAAGDLYLIQGQSNSLANDFHHECMNNPQVCAEQNAGPWIRSFGTISPIQSQFLEASVDLDLHWGQATAKGRSHVYVGAWALKLARELVNGYEIPIGIMSGGEGGQDANYFQRDDAQPDNRSTNYGRWLTRADVADPTRSYRALFWYQGESDAGIALSYPGKFTSLFSDWESDFSTTEKVYVFQVRERDCLDQVPGVREFQRNASGLNPKISLMSTTAVPCHDGTHFFFAGYERTGENIYRLVSRDLYGSVANPTDVEPPNLLLARWLSSVELELTFANPNDTIVWGAGAENDIRLDGQVAAISNVVVVGNRVTLTLGTPSTALTVSYVGQPCFGACSCACTGPWITNALGVGALTFFDVVIQ